MLKSKYINHLKTERFLYFHFLKFAIFDRPCRPLTAAYEPYRYTGEGQVVNMVSLKLRVCGFGSICLQTFYENLPIRKSAWRNKKSNGWKLASVFLPVANAMNILQACIYNSVKRAYFKILCGHKRCLIQNYHAFLLKNLVF